MKKDEGLSVQRVFSRRKKSLNYHLQVLGAGEFLDEPLLADPNKTSYSRKLGRGSRTLFEKFENYEMLYAAREGYRKAIKQYHPDQHHQQFVSLRGQGMWRLR